MGRKPKQLKVASITSSEKTKRGKPTTWCQKEKMIVWFQITENFKLLTGGAAKGQEFLILFRKN